MARRSRLIAASLACVLAAMTTPAWAQSPEASPREAPAATTPAQDPAAPHARYLSAMREVLEAMRLAPTCETLSAARARCEVRHVDAQARRELVLTLIYSDVTDTLYLFVPRLVSAAPEDASTPALLRRLMELNFRLLGAKLEWDPSNGEVRLSATLHTDSNLDRRALRSMVLTLFSVADRYEPELQRILDMDQ